MGSTGGGIVSRNDLVLTTSGCPPRRNGLYLMSRGEALLPYGDGYLCHRRLPAADVEDRLRRNGLLPLDLQHLRRESMKQARLVFSSSSGIRRREDGLHKATPCASRSVRSAPVRFRPAAWAPACAHVASV
jgi:hypothetical protein